MKKKMLNRWISLVLVMIILLSHLVLPTSAEDKVNLNDVTSYYPFSSWAVDTGIKHKIIFLENNKRETKRLEIVNIIYSILNLEQEEITYKSFADISGLPDDEKAKIQALVKEEIISGYKDGTFKPNANVTRAEFVTMLDKSGILTNYYTSSVRSFDDISNHWAKKSINNIVSSGVMDGKGQNKFCPNQNITPQEIFIILDRLVGLNCINSDTLVGVMTSTFKCKKYSQEEQYVIETMYSEFDKVQNEISLRWFYPEYYNPCDWQELATYKDLLYVLYFTISRNANVYEKTDSGELEIDKFAKCILGMQGLDYNNENHLSKTLTMRELMYGIYAGEAIDVFDIQVWDDFWYLFDDKKISKVEFSNFDVLSERDKGVISDACIETTYTKNVLPNNSMYFSMDIPVTKYMLNFLIVQLQKRYEFLKKDLYSDVSNFFGLSNLNMETDYAKLPTNYKEYPYIIAGIPKEVYEQPFAYNDSTDFYNAKESYNNYHEFTYGLVSNSSKFYDLILNVDYRTMNVDEFVEQAITYSDTTSEAARKYAQYVIDNQIILEGRGCIIPGTIFLADPFAYARSVINFRIVSAKEKKNILYEDLRNLDAKGFKQPVIYNKNSYSLVFDTMISGVVNPSKGRITSYRINTGPIIRCIYYYDNNTIHTMPD